MEVTYHLLDGLTALKLLALVVTGLTQANVGERSAHAFDANKWDFTRDIAYVTSRDITKHQPS